MAARWAEWWSERLPELRAAVEDRAALLEGERDDLAELIRAEKETGRLTPQALRELEGKLEAANGDIAARIEGLRAAVAAPPPLARVVSITMVVG